MSDFSVSKRSNAKIYDLRINDLYAPMGIDSSNPVFSWKMASENIGARQTAYSVTVSDEQGSSVWETGWVQSDASIGIRYEGKRLEGATKYFVSVKIKDETGALLEASSCFEMGLLGENPFKEAKWIVLDEKEKTQGNLPAMRKSFVLQDKEIVRARLYICALGVYEAYINGKRISRVLENGEEYFEELKPGYTQMEDRKLYSTFDVGSMLFKGEENVISSIVTSGWWNGPVVQFMMPDSLCFKENGFLAKLVITYCDGTQTVLDTDETWKASRASAYQEGTGIWEGEVFDASVDQSWMLPGYCDANWQKVKFNTEFKGKICAFADVPVTVRKDLERKAEKITVYKGACDVKEGFYGKINVESTQDYIGEQGIRIQPDQTLLVDFGQNFSGWERMKIKAEKGTRVFVKHGEMLNDNNGQISRQNDGPEGSLYNINYTKNTATVGRTIYFASGDPNGESYHPTFTFYGFRYIEMTADKPITLYEIAGEVVSSAYKDTGILTTSDEAVNKLISNARWGMYSNYLSVPTDCPQRDERQGWTADTQNFAEAGCYLNDSKSFLRKFMQDVRDAQDSATGSIPGVAPTGYKNGARWGVVGWADAVVLIPWFLYLMYGDASVIKENWDAMQLFMDTYMASTNGCGGAYGTFLGPDGEKQGAYGDWLSLENDGQEVSDRISVAYYAWDAMLMAKMAKVIGKSEETVEKYEALYKKEKELFISRYVKENGEVDLPTQSVCLHALYLDLLPDESSIQAVTNQLIQNIESKGNKLFTGFLGTEIIMHTLTKIGRSDVAFRLLLQHEFPSWLYSVDQGATTIWERWNSYTLENGFFGKHPGGNSFNHYSYGSVVAWMFRAMAGISYDEEKPGFKHIVLMPQRSDAVPAVSASYESAYGKIVSRMRKENGLWYFDAEIPANTSATILLPTEEKESICICEKEITENIPGISFEKYDENKKTAIFKAVAGKYSFCAK